MPDTYAEGLALNLLNVNLGGRWQSGQTMVLAYRQW